MKRSTRPQAADILAENVHRLLESDTYKAALKFHRAFHRYSMTNALLIYLQMPEATQVAGYRVWQQFGRQVKKGEKGIRISAPLARRNEEGKNELIGFRTVSVFDCSQTEGDALPEVPACEALTQTDARIPGFMLSLEAFAQAQGSPVEYIPLNGSMKGYFRPKTGEIKVAEGLPPLEGLAVLIHEIAHALAHKGDEKPRSVEELEAESCAFLVCDALGLDTSGQSFAYLANWTDDPATVLPAATFAAKLADQVLEALNEPLLIPPNAEAGFASGAAW